MKDYKKVFTRIIQTYIEEERRFKESDPSLGDVAYDILMKKTKGRVIDQFLAAKVVSLPVDKLIKTHRGTFYSIEDMAWKIDDDEPINVVRHNGKLLILDGHHRVLIHRIIGRKKIQARFIDLDKKRKKKNDIKRNI